MCSFKCCRMEIVLTKLCECLKLKYMFSPCKLVSPGPSTTTETETIAKYEIMDGAPVKGK